MSVELHSEASREVSGKPASLASRLVSATAHHLDWLTAIVLIALTTPVALFRSGLTVPLPHPNLLDDSWQVDIAYKAFTGSWLYRNVIFTYGPLYQLITSLPSRVSGFSVGTFISNRLFTFLWVTIVLTLAASKILLNAEPAWKRGLFIVLVIVFWSPVEIRVSAILFFFALFLHVVDRVVKHRSRPWQAAIVCSVSLMCAFMVSADAGMYSVAALMVIVLASATLNCKSGPVVTGLALFGALTVASFAVLGIVANLILGGGPLAYRFLRDAYEIVSIYRWVEPSPISKLNTRVVAWTVAVGFSILLLAWRWRDPRSEVVTRQPLFLLSAPLFALVVLQSGLVRSDWGHLTIGVFPVIFFALAVFIGTGSPALLRGSLCVFLAIGLSGIAAGPFPSFLPHSIKSNLANYSFPQVITPANCTGAYLDHVCFGLPEGETLALTAGYLQKHTAVGDSVLIYPYENEAGVAARRKVAGAVLQNYLVAGDYLTNRQLRDLQVQRPAYGLYFVDSPGVYKIGGVTNFSRTPLVWLYMQSHYRTEAEVVPGVFAVVRDENRAMRIRQQATVLDGVERSVAITTNPQTIDLGPVRWPQGAEFLRLRINAHYSAFWKFRKPADLVVELDLADGSSKRTFVVIPPNTAFDAWIYPWDEPSLGKFLDPLEANWRGAVGPPVVRIKIIVEKKDWISARPKRVTVLGAEGISLQP
jgi:hypothetical protein